MSISRGMLGQGDSRAHQSDLGPGAVEGQQAAYDVVIGGVRRVVVPAIGGGHGPVQLFMRHCQPGRAGVVEVGERAFLQVGPVARLGNRARGEAGLFFLGRDDPLDPVRRIQPGFAQAVELERGLGEIRQDRRLP